MSHRIGSIALAVLLLAAFLVLPTQLVAAQENADISVAVMPKYAKAKFGETISYTVTVTNHGAAAATGVWMWGSISDHFNPVSAICSQGTSDTNGCEFGTVQPGASATAQMTIVVMHFPKGETRWAFFGAYVGATTFDPNPDNNYASGTAIIVGRPTR